MAVFSVQESEIRYQEILDTNLMNAFTQEVLLFFYVPGA
jgi:hypothetical protein